MSNDLIPKELLLGQLADALEERQRPDRRQRDAGLPQDVSAERRKGDRRQRAKKAAKPSSEG